jgi:RNA-directed DNA polymerase
VSEPKPKSFVISKRAVWEAWLRVKANKGAAGVDEQSIMEFERDLQGNLCKLWNRLSSGSYMPPPVRMVEIPKRDGSPRVLGVPTVADRIAQTVVRLVLEPGVEPFFHPDSYGYRPGRSALDAVGVCRERCWRLDWVLDIDIRSSFAMWSDGCKRRSSRRMAASSNAITLTPQGSAISPLLANMFLHYAFDEWMVREHRLVLFERYCDDVIVHARSEQHARDLRAAIASRLAERGLELNEQKTRIVYCKDDQRRGSSEHTSFDFLGYTLRRRLSRRKHGGQFVNFLPAASDDARKRIRREIRGWRLHLRPGKTISDLARIFNPIIRGWINYYGRFYRSVLVKVLRRINAYLVRWAQGKYKRLRRYPAQARRFLVDVFRHQPDLFAHWQFGTRPDVDDRSPVSRETHAGI